MKKHVSSEIKRYNHLIGEIEAAYHEASLKLGVSDSVMRILYTICVFGDGYPLRDICKITGLSKQTVNSAIRGLEADGIVYLESANGKMKNVFLTEKGKAFEKDAALRIVEIENDIFNSWSNSDVEKYLELTENFLVSFKNKVGSL